MDYYQIVCEALTLTTALACVFALKNSEWTSGVTKNLKLKQKWLKRLLPHLTSCFWSLSHDPLLFFGNVLLPAPITFSTSSCLQKHHINGSFQVTTSFHPLQFVFPLNYCLCSWSITAHRIQNFWSDLKSYKNLKIEVEGKRKAGQQA